MTIDARRRGSGEQPVEIAIRGVYNLIDVCIANPRSVGVFPRKSGLPLEALR
jgi:hypothetical protein